MAERRDRSAGRAGGRGLLAALAIVSAWVGGCRSPAPQPNVLLVSLDTVRLDQTSLARPDPGTTPVLARLGEEGVVFDAAYAPSPVTAPSHASLMSGRYPVEHGVTTNGLGLPGDLPWLAELLGEHRFDTAAFVSSFVLGRKFGWDRGFVHFDDAFRPEDASVVGDSWEGFPLSTGALDQRATRTTEKALTWVRSRVGGASLFVWVHYFDPHTPYDPPAEYLRWFLPGETPGEDRLAEDLARYRAEIRYTDHEMGRLIGGLREARAGEEWLVVVIADHGEGFLEHGHVHHGLTLYEEAVRIPFVVHWPERVPGGRRAGLPVSLVDFPATLLGLLRIEAPALAGDGIDLSGLLLASRAEPAHRPVYFQRRVFPPGATDELFDPPWARRERGNPIVGEQHGSLVGGLKYLEAPEERRVELYDLSRDPGEQVNLAAEQTGLVRSRAQELRAFVAARRARALGAGPMSPEDRARLRALGYLP